eukprot:CAMPEP_0119568652 /NCGR_PEP_ID=MMETSP1352-20130426/39489_1 /TAXON_ID=265584 /ORGANISM="Stauroneis constricta, Strain CCMP1120" /LENGTH=170 /DNA_ID=CAMNT_0007618093 /DNA_START=180 /DNA_END=689 /DNA_ORIENTATION=+
MIVMVMDSTTNAWQMPPSASNHLMNRIKINTNGKQSATQLHVFAKDKQQQADDKSLDDTTEKYGLEAGLLQAAKEKDGGESAKSLLKKYGIAYLATSIPLALVSFSICYVLVDNGVDMASLLSGIGIDTAGNGMADKAGTFAIAYAAHKALSPVRFPPTVLLTPVVAKLI